MATHSRILAWRIPWTEEPSGLQSIGCKELDTTEATQHTGTINRNRSQYPFSEQMRNSLQSPFPDSGTKLLRFKTWELTSLSSSFKMGSWWKFMYIRPCVCLTIIRTPKKKSYLSSLSLSLLLVHAHKFLICHLQAVSILSIPTSTLKSYSTAKTLENPVPHLSSQDPCYRL